MLKEIITTAKTDGVQTDKDATIYSFRRGMLRPRLLLDTSDSAIAENAYRTDMEVFLSTLYKALAATL